MEKTQYLTSDKFKELKLDGNIVLRVSSVQSKMYDGNMITLKLPSSVDKNLKRKYTVTANLEWVKVNMPKDEQYPYSIDKELGLLYKENKDFYRKLYNFADNRYRDLMNRNDFLNKSQYDGLCKQHIDTNTVFYGKAFMSCIPEMLKFHKIKPIKFKPEFIRNNSDTERLSCVILDKKLLKLATEIFSK